MKSKFNHLNCIKKLISCSPRQLEGEKLAAVVIKEILSNENISFFAQKFIINIPKIKKTQLVVDGKKLKGIQGCSIVGGKINGKENIISSLIPSAQFLDKENININPLCSGVSASNHYFAPAVAVDHESMGKILKGKKVDGFVEVEKVKHETENILVGNRKDPEVICFAHYDSINMGAIDNASGVATALKTIVENKHLPEKTLFVFSAAEELSYDKPVYWGYGFRVFEKKCLNLLQNAKKILVIDCVGNGKTEIIKDKKFLKLGFPISNVERLSDKISLISADYEKLMTVYHSNLDDGRTIQKKYLDDAYKLLTTQIEKNCA